MNGSTFHIPTLETVNLRLRAPRLEDFEQFAAFRVSERSRMVGGPYTRAQAFEQLAALVGHWSLRGYGRWIVADRKDDTAQGVVGPFLPEGWPEPEIAWSVFEGAEGKGIAFEAAEAALAYAYETLRWTTAVSLIDRANLRSASLAQRLGAVREGVFEHPAYGELDIWRHAVPADSTPVVAA